MAVKQIFVSDISGKEIAEGDSARIIVYEHPALDGSPVELDVDASEAAGIENGKLPIVSLKIIEPDRPQGRRVIMDVTTFNQLFQDQEVEELLGGARRASSGSGGSGGRSRRSPELVSTDPAPIDARSEGPAKAERLDYSSAEHAGTLHRGRVTEAEALFVRENLDVANENRRRAGQQEIDPEDPKERLRYGL